MGLLGSLAEKLASSAMGGSAGAQPQNAISAAMALLNHPSVGGVGGLAQLFQNQGLGHLVSGWISSGPNPAVSPAQIQQVLGSGPIAEFASKLGIPEDQAAAHLAEILPHIVDHLTPNGTVPPAGAAGDLASAANLESAAEELKKKLFG